MHSDCARNASFILLRTRFLWGWLPIFRDVAIPTKPVPGSAEILQMLPEARLPLRKISSNLVLEGPWPIALMGEPGASLYPSALQHVTPVGRAHPNAKTVCGLLVPLIG